MTAAIEAKELSYRYADGSYALSKLSFAIGTGECVGVVGPNGAGKSTLLLHTNGILPDHGDCSGEIYVDGVRISPQTIWDIRRKVGLLFQDPDDQLFCPTVYEDVAFGPRQFGWEKGRLEEMVRAALAKVGLNGFEKRSPDRLSNGEKRRVCMAGVLACEASILVLDEPTSGLDPRGRRELKKLLRELPATKIIATHDLELVVELCPRTILLDHGELIADGRTVELLSDERLMLEHGLEKPHILQHRHPH